MDATTITRLVVQAGSNATSGARDPYLIIGQSWVPPIPLPILLAAALSALFSLVAIFGSIQVAREKRNGLDEEMNFDKTDDDEPPLYTLRNSSSSQSEYIHIDPSNPRIDPTRRKTPCPATAAKNSSQNNSRAPSCDENALMLVPPAAAVPPRHPKPANLSHCHKNIMGAGTVTDKMRRERYVSLTSTRLSPPSPPTSSSPPILHLDPVLSVTDDSTSDSKCHSNLVVLSSSSSAAAAAAPSSDGVKARESSSAPMVMNGLWGRIERLLNKGLHADARCCQMESVQQYNNNSALRPSSSDSAPIHAKPMRMVSEERPSNSTGSSSVQSHDASSQTDMGSISFPRKITCKCCRNRQEIGVKDLALRRSSSSALLRGARSRSNSGTPIKHRSLSDHGCPSPGRPRLAIDEEDVSKRRCLSVDEHIRRYRLCYGSSSGEEDTEEHE